MVRYKKVMGAVRINLKMNYVVNQIIVESGRLNNKLEAHNSHKPPDCLVNSLVDKVLSNNSLLQCVELVSSKIVNTK